MVDCAVMNVRKHDQKSPSSNTLTHSLVVAAFSVVLTLLGGKLLHYFEANSTAQRNFQLMVKDMALDIGNHDDAAFVSKARSFARNMATGRMPDQYGREAEMFSGKGDIAGLARQSAAAINTYLSECVDGKAIYDQKEFQYLCEQDLHSYVRDSLQELDRRIDIDRVTYWSTWP